MCVVDELDDGLDGRTVVFVVCTKLVNVDLFHLLDIVVFAKRSDDVEFLAARQGVSENISIWTWGRSVQAGHRGVV